MAEHSLWVEKFRPKTLDESVWIDANQQHQVTAWVQERCTMGLLRPRAGGPVPEVPSRNHEAKASSSGLAVPLRDALPATRQAGWLRRHACRRA